MGCLFEVLFEVLVEGVLEGIVYGYIKLMSLIVPAHMVSEKTKNRIGIVVKVYAVILMVAIVIGLILLLQNDLYIKNIGRYCIFISLILSGIQVVLGMISKIIIIFVERKN